MNDELNKQFVNAVCNAPIDQLQDFIDRGADVNCVVHQNPPLIWAIMSRNVDIVRFLVEAGADPVYAPVNDISYYLYWAIEKMHIEAFDYLVGVTGYDIANDPGCLVFVAVHEAEAEQYDGTKMVKYFVEKGIDLNRVNDRGLTLLEYCREIYGEEYYEDVNVVGYIRRMMKEQEDIGIVKGVRDG